MGGWGVPARARANNLPGRVLRLASMPPLVQASRIKPAALRAGDTVGVVAPASSFKSNEFEAGCEALRRMGYKPVYSESIFAHDLYFAGSPERRVQEFEE